MQFYTYIGAIHVHSTYSDGRGELAAIIAAAQKIGLNFLILTEHNTLLPLKEGKEGYYGSVLVLIGEEISPPQNHYLAMGIKTEVPPGPQPQTYLDAVTSQGGIGFLAHPASQGKPLTMALDFNRPWREWPSRGYTGFELWNWQADFLANVHNYWDLARAFLNPDQFIEGPPSTLLARWDTLTQQRRLVAIGSVDTHGFPPGRHYQLKALNTFLVSRTAFTGDFAQDKKLVLTGLREGNCFLAYQYLGVAGDFAFWGERGPEIILMGEAARAPLSLHVHLPRPAHLRLLRSGQILKELPDTQELHLQVKQAGVYRVEVYVPTLRRGLRPWIFSNPIYVRL